MIFGLRGSDYTSGEVFRQIHDFDPRGKLTHTLGKSDYHAKRIWFSYSGGQITPVCEVSAKSERSTSWVNLTHTQVKSGYHAKWIWFSDSGGQITPLGEVSAKSEIFDFLESLMWDSADWSSLRSDVYFLLSRFFFVLTVLCFFFSSSVMYLFPYPRPYCFQSFLIF